MLGRVSAEETESPHMNLQDCERFKKIDAIFAEALKGKLSMYVGTGGCVFTEIRVLINEDKLRGVFWPAVVQLFWRHAKETDGLCPKLCFSDY